MQSVTAWAPGGRRILLADDRGILWVPDSGGVPSTLVNTGGISVPWSFSPDGRHVGYSRIDPQTAFDLWTVPVESDSGGLRAGTPVAFPRWSRSGRELFYATDDQRLMVVRYDHARRRSATRLARGRPCDWPRRE